MGIHSLLLSIKPKFAEKIFAGEKTVELRRIRPRVAEGDTVLVYVSSPTKALIGGFEVASVVESEPEKLWSTVKDCAGITEEEFIAYYSGSERAFGIFIKRSWHLKTPLDLSKLKNKWADFHPPQSYRYLSLQEANLLGVV